MALIEVEHLQKRFRVPRRRPGPLGRLRGLVARDAREVAAVEDISFRVGRGELVGYVGPNGAGKSTTIKMLTGILVPSAGRVVVDGLVPWRERRRLAGRIGVVFGQRTQLWWDLPLIESLRLLRHVYRVPAERYRRNLARCTDLLDLGPFLDRPVRQLSLGQRMRGDLAAALLHDPAILYLDEPTIGLDVVAKERIRAFLRDLNRESGVTVLLTTHDLADIARVCERMLIIDHGRLLYDGGVGEIAARYGGERRLVVDLDEEVACPDVPGARLERREGARLWLSFRREDISAPELIARVTGRYAVRDLTLEEPDIEEIVRRIYQKGLPGAAPAPPVTAGAAPIP
ncbi:MAG TPA: ATP-binding cassette domain-containing protein [Thermomicrobiales bacterium]|nr:ATP-binding cassette domain-containing protein [Thermomicrobiales bacterium]